jgi:hypothetical protein
MRKLLLSIAAALALAACGNRDPAAVVVANPQPVPAPTVVQPAPTVVAPASPTVVAPASPTVVVPYGTRVCPAGTYC